jgi:hypothetical protein
VVITHSRDHTQGIASTGLGVSDYLSTLRAIFANHGTYEDKVRAYSHCITIEYAGERKIDIAPCVIDRLGTGGEEVCNRDTNAFQPTAPAAYTKWLLQRNSWTGTNALKKVTRLLKYLRDIKSTFTCASFLLTTLLGARIVADDANNEAEFADVPTSLRTIVGRLDSWLQQNPTRPRIQNPVMSSELVSELWNNDQYGNFRDKIHLYREWIDDAYAEEDRDESIGKWRRVFGEDFAKSVVLDMAASVTESALLLRRDSTLARLPGVHDLVTLFGRYGSSALPVGFDALPHKARPTWRRAGALLTINVAATLHPSKHGPELRDVSSGDGPLPKEHWLRFSAMTNSAVQLGTDYDIRWRVMNTDREARAADCLRGGFEESDERATRWELLRYRGVHSVEAFAVRRRDQLLVGQSAPFYVVVA